MKKLALGFLLVLSLLAFSAAAAEMTGYISDAKCAKDVAKVESDGHAGRPRALGDSRRAKGSLCPEGGYRQPGSAKEHYENGHSLRDTNGGGGEFRTQRLTLAS